MTVTVRDARDEDDLDALHVGDRTWIGADPVRAAFAAAPADIPQAMLVAERDGGPAGYAHAVGAGICDGFRGMASLHVLPAHRRHGVGSALWARVLETCAPTSVPGVMLDTDAADATSIAIAEAHGLRQGGLHRESVLDLTRDDIPSVVVDGFVLRHLDDDEAGWQLACDLHNRLAADAPDNADGGEDMPYAVYRSFHVEPWQVLVGYDGGVAVGYTAVLVSKPAEREVNTSFTGVDAAYRGRGLATALKATHAHALAAAGWRTVRTQNMDGNASILAANKRLGFVLVGANRDLIYDHPAT